MKIAKNKFVSSAFLLFCLSFNNLVFAKIEIVLGNAPLKGNPNLALNAPINSASEIIVSRDQYVLSYNKTRRSANWVAWKLEADQIGNSGRSNLFLQDADLENYLAPSRQHAVDSTEYKGSCFDRGHQVPSADRTDIRENNEITFFMSNMIPQTAYLNRVIWEHLEQYTRDLVQKEGKKAYIIAGPIYDQDFGVIGPKRDIPVPSKNFKVIIILNADQSPADINNDTQIISVIMPNTLEDGTRQVTDSSLGCKTTILPDVLDRRDWEKYKTSLSEVEALSGFKIISKN